VQAGSFIRESCRIAALQDERAIPLSWLKDAGVKWMLSRRADLHEQRYYALCARCFAHLIDCELAFKQIKK
jgi:hypothetical protein